MQVSLSQIFLPIWKGLSTGLHTKHSVFLYEQKEYKRLKVAIKLLDFK